MEEISRGYWLGTVPHAGGVVGSSGKRMAARVSRGSSGKRLIFEGCFWETTRNGAMGERSGKGSNLAASHSLPNMGDQTSVAGKFPQRGDGETFQERFKSRCISRMAEKKGDHTSVPGNFPQRGDGETFQEMFKSRCNLTDCQTWEITRQFQETSRNGAMEESSGKQFKCLDPTCSTEFE
jgi:hypothetical protein